MRKYNVNNNILFALCLSILLIFVTGITILSVNNLSKSNVIIYLITYIIISSILLFIFRKELLKDFKAIKTINKKIIIYFIISSILLILVPISNKIIYSFTNIESTNSILLSDLLYKSPLIVSIISIIFGPFVEEIIYRYVYKNVSSNRLITYITYSVIFALAHVVLFNTTSYVYLISYLLLSFGIGYPFYKTNNIWYSFIIHVLNNLINVLILLFIV